MDNCLFCKMVQGDIPVSKVYEDAHTLAFHDIAPQAPVHVLVIPKRHLDGLNDQPEDAGAVFGHLMRAVKEVAALTGVSQSGYRLISNCGPDACQSVQHLHFHVLGGKQLPEKMS